MSATNKNEMMGRYGMFGYKLLGATAAALICVGGSAASAADVAEPAPDDSGWTFTAAPYLWGSGINGQVGLFGLPAQDVSASFSDILQNLDFGFMGLGEARKGRLSFGTDIVYAKIGASVDTPFGILASDIGISSSVFLGTGYAGYSLLYSEDANVDLIAGARVWSVNTTFDFNGGKLDGRSAQDGDTWVDPIIGAKFRANLGTSKFYAAGWGMVGGFGVSSDFMWDVMAGLGYDFNRTFSVFGGYRATGVDYSNDGFVYDVTQHGPLLGGVFNF
jgi:hypothetical protein